MAKKKPTPKGARKPAFKPAEKNAKPAKRKSVEDFIAEALPGMEIVPSVRRAAAVTTDAASEGDDWTNVEPGIAAGQVQADYAGYESARADQTPQDSARASKRDAKVRSVRVRAKSTGVDAPNIIGAKNVIVDEDKGIIGMEG
jgi:hypothetical protein